MRKSLTIPRPHLLADPDPHSRVREFVLLCELEAMTARAQTAETLAVDAVRLVKADRVAARIRRDNLKPRSRLHSDAERARWVKDATAYLAGLSRAVVPSALAAAKHALKRRHFEGDKALSAIRAHLAGDASFCKALLRAKKKVAKNEGK
jgi:hypothetical protein